MNILIKYIAINYSKQKLKKMDNRFISDLK